MRKLGPGLRGMGLLLMLIKPFSITCEGRMVVVILIQVVV